MRIINKTKLDFDDVLLVPQRSKTASRKDVDVTRKFNFYHSRKEWKGVPIIASNMDTTGTFAMADALSDYGCITCLHKHYSTSSLIDFLSSRSSSRINSMWISIGIKNGDLKKLSDISDAIGYLPNICVDVANGYTDDFVDFCNRARCFSDYNNYNPIIMAGNVCTPEMVQEIILHGGVDIVKIGIGPGSACTTRLKTGVGYPQLSAIEECAHAAHGLRKGTGRLGLICADGGCRHPADVVKAFAAGADFVMLGGMLAGTDECEGEWKYVCDEKTNMDRKDSLLFYGMSSQKAQEKHGEGLKEYRSSEGRVINIPYKGPAKPVIADICGGIRSACAYTGATSLKDFSKTADFIKVNRVHFDRSI